MNSIEENGQVLAKLSYGRPTRGDSPLSPEDYASYLSQLPGWTVIAEHHLSRAYRFPDFLQGLAFVNAVAGVAEDMGHHPDIALSWGQVRIEVHTHDIDGLALIDFVLAARIERFYN